MARTRDMASWELSRQRVLDAALDLFGEKGYDAATMQEIAERVGVTKAAIYYYFPTKSALLDAILSPAHEEANQLLDEAEKLATKAEQIAAALSAMIDSGVAHRRALAVLNRDPAVTRHPTYVRNAAELQNRLQQLFFGRKPTPDERTAFYLSYGLSGAVLHLDDLTDDQLREALHRVLYRTLGLEVPGRATRRTKRAVSDS
jgi:AcrR family transcriptional regulator